MVAIEVGADQDKNLARMMRHVEIGREIAEAQEEKAGDNSRHNQRLKALREEERRIRDAISTGKETIHVDCYERINEQLQQVETVRRDTEQVLPNLTRPMTSEERQVEAFPDAAQAGAVIDDTEGVEASAEEPKKKRGRKKKADQAEPAENAAE